MQLPDLDIYRSFDWLRFAPVGIDSRLERDFSLPLKVPGVSAVPERGIRLVTELIDDKPVYNDSVHALDGDRCAGPLLLRNWRPGDRLNAEKIKTLFQEARIPLWERRTWPVIARPESGTVLWTRQFGADGDFSAGPETRRILFVQETRESNPIDRASTVVAGNEEVL